MTGSLFRQDSDTTHLTEEEREGLIPSYIALRSELNAAEQSNILQAELWAFERQRDVLNEGFLLNLHKRMFYQVWRWAGKIRDSERNIGIEPYRIRQELGKLLDDCNFWLKNNTYDVDESVIRFHHRLVYIHAFPDGNGRHARMATDLLLVNMKRRRFSWGQHNLAETNETRRQYVAALRAADKRDISLLLEFVRS